KKYDSYTISCRKHIFAKLIETQCFSQVFILLKDDVGGVARVTAIAPGGRFCPPTQRTTCIVFGLPFIRDTEKLKMQSYQEFLDLSVGFPQDGFDIIDDELYFHDLNLMEMIETYGTPLRFTYLPIISKKIQQAKILFQTAILKHNYRGTYKYCYCTKSSHFKHVVEEALKNDIHLETSSAFDMPMIDALEKKGVVDKEITVIC